MEGRTPLRPSGHDKAWPSIIVFLRLDRRIHKNKELDSAVQQQNDTFSGIVLSCFVVPPRGMGV
jgi:hypothetical protein